MPLPATTAFLRTWPTSRLGATEWKPMCAQSTGRLSRRCRIVYSLRLAYLNRSIRTRLTKESTGPVKVAHIPPAWGQIVSKLFDAHGKRAHGATYESRDGAHTIFLHMLGFVDDMKNHVNDMMEPATSSVASLVSKMAEDSQLWSDLLHTAGGALEFPKLYCYVRFWQFEPSGRPYLDNTIHITLPISSPDRSSTVYVLNKYVHTARRTIGPIKCPAGIKKHSTTPSLPRVMISPKLSSPCSSQRRKRGLHISRFTFQ
jgi:hypothetical protein